jgi:hypothetical protein
MSQRAQAVFFAIDQHRDGARQGSPIIFASFIA